MNDENKRIIEIEGVKLEVDLRKAKQIDTYKVGDPIKVLDKSYSDIKVRAGVIVGFSEFKENPTIDIMMLSTDYGDPTFSFISIHKGTTKYEIAPYNNYENLFKRVNVIEAMDKEITKKELELENLKTKRKYFIDEYSKAFNTIIGEE